jgi:hypothetical protein
VHWLYIGLAAVVRSTSKSGNLFVVSVENKWFCCGECFSDFIDRKMDESDLADAKTKKYLKASRKKH